MRNKNINLFCIKGSSLQAKKIENEETKKNNICQHTFKHIWFLPAHITNAKNQKSLNFATAHNTN